jgi:pSer/pThr/pTyr-binding forkhead associated (FHA) protein
MGPVKSSLRDAGQEFYANKKVATMDINLIMFKANGQQKSIPMNGESAVLGRGPECGIRVPVDSCSRRQCELKVEDGKLILRDLNSANGTYVNSERVEQTVLTPGDKITLGPVVLTVQINGEPAEVMTTQSVDASAAVTDTSEELLSDDEYGLADEDPLAALSSVSKGGDDDDPLAALEALSK